MLSHSRLVEMVSPDAFRGLSEVKLYISYLRRTFRHTVGIDPSKRCGIGYCYPPQVEEMP